MAFLMHFHTNSSIPKGCYASFFTAILKVKDPKYVRDYRPISLIGCEYKIIGKILVDRLAMVIGSVVVQNSLLL